MLSVPLLLSIIAAALFAWFWQSSLSARERANRAAIDACQRMNLQFLDGTVAFARLGLARNDRGHISLRRTYIFDYTATSIERRQGFVVLLGVRVESLGFEPEVRASTSRIHGQSGAPADADAAHGDHDPHTDSNVLNLDEWRHRRRKLPRPGGQRGDAGDNSGNTPSDNGW